MRLNFGLAMGAVVVALGTPQCGGGAFSSLGDGDASDTQGDGSGFASSGASGSSASSSSG